MNDESIQSMGGKARDAALSDERKKDAVKAAAARWGDKPVVAIRKGNFKEKFDIDVDCYVLDDHQKTAVISQIGMGKAIGLSPRGNAFPRFLASKAMSGEASAQIRQKLSQPVKLQWGASGAQGLSNTVHGFDATLLIDLCQEILRVEKNLDRQQKHVADQARVILNASAKLGIKNLVYAISGYNPTAEEVIAAFKAYVQEEAKKYTPEFPDELYERWYKLYEIPVLERGKPWHFKHLTLKHIYYPLAKSNGKITELLRATKQAGGKRGDKLFQFLNEVGARALRMHLGRVLEMAESSPDKATYEKKILERFGDQPELKLEFFPPTIELEG